MYIKYKENMRCSTSLMTRTVDTHHHGVSMPCVRARVVVHVIHVVAVLGRRVVHAVVHVIHLLRLSGTNKYRLVTCCRGILVASVVLFGVFWKPAGGAVNVRANPASPTRGSRRHRVVLF